jgi:sterol 24-C-methyltransferase
MNKPGLSRDEVREAVNEYVSLHDDAQASVEDRRAAYTTLVNHYYDLVTDFYEFGWGQSFHFAPRRRGETFAKSLSRHEHRLVDAMHVRPGMELLDVGCGVGGPMREIARHSGCRVVGLNNNAYQISRGEVHNQRAGLTGLVSFLKADFMDIPVADGRFDGVYTIEASCHAPDKVALFSELRRVLKPGGFFAGYEWCLTDRFDAADPRHQQIKKDIEAGDGLPDIAHTHEVDAALEAAGFEVVEARDLAVDPCDHPWFESLAGRERSLRALPRTPMGRAVTRRVTGLLERTGFAPEGTAEVSEFLNRAADALVAGGETGIFTPMYFFVARSKR